MSCLTDPPAELRREDRRTRDRNALHRWDCMCDRCIWGDKADHMNGKETEHEEEE